MKKAVIIAGALLVFGMTSCKKEYSCDCTIAGETIENDLGEIEKEDAEAACDVLKAVATLTGGSCTLTTK
ncbi:MAG: hypothetical protein HRT72_13710 [Flavobacteriales bacterium]|nr:hypothetical protein [Flavobacteriales bacterium]